MASLLTTSLMTSSIAASPGRDELGDLVHVGVRHGEDPAHVPHHRPGLHLSEGDDLGHILFAVFLAHILDDPLPAVVAEVHVDIRHADALWVQEALEEQVILDGIDVGDIEAIGDQAARSGAPAGSDGDIVGLGVTDEIGDDEEISGKARLLDNGQLIIEPVLVPLLQVVGEGLVRTLNVIHLPGVALSAKLLEVLFCGLPLRHLEVWKMVIAFFEGDVAHLGDQLRIGHRFGIGRKAGPHLLGRLEIELVGAEGQPVLIVHGFTGLDAQKKLMGPGLFLFQIVAVVRCHEGAVEVA